MSQGFWTNNKILKIFLPIAMNLILILFVVFPFLAGISLALVLALFPIIFIGFIIFFILGIKGKFLGKVWTSSDKTVKYYNDLALKTYLISSILGAIFILLWITSGNLLILFLGTPIAIGQVLFFGLYIYARNSIKYSLEDEDLIKGEKIVLQLNNAYIEGKGFASFYPMPLKMVVFTNKRILISYSINVFETLKHSMNLYYKSPKTPYDKLFGLTHKIKEISLGKKFILIKFGRSLQTYKIFLDNPKKAYSLIKKNS